MDINMKKRIIALFCFVTMLTSCEDFFQMRLTNDREEDDLVEIPAMIRGLMTMGYNTIPTRFNTLWGEFPDCATDNAVSNDINSALYKMGNQDGYWTNTSSPIDNWNGTFESIRAINDFFERSGDKSIQYLLTSPEDNENYRKRIIGEAYFLRAWAQFDLLRRFAGYDESGELLCYPIMTKTMSIDKIKMLSRNKFEECVTQILSDIDSALESDGLKEEYVGSDIVFGEQHLGRPTTVACKALKSRVLLFAASPAYNKTNDVEKYKLAAKAAKDVIDIIGTSLPNLYTLEGLNTTNNDELSKQYMCNDKNDELIMRRLAGDANNTYFANLYFPPAPGLIGGGKANPSQNLVDAFPMANGYPINHPSGNYNRDDMYKNRDPRLYMTVLYNGVQFKGVEVQTYDGGNCMIGATGVTEKNTTRTGYFLRKWVSPQMNLIAGNTSGAWTYFALFRKVEMFLNFAEAAEAAYGADDKSLGMSARDAIAEVRRRAGIAKGGNDSYLDEVQGEDFKNLIKNERRVELCFENHRFYDIRRWNDDLNTPIKAIRFSGPDDKTGEIYTLDSPSYKDYMRYGPIPNAEVLKSSTIKQNQGW